MVSYRRGKNNLDSGAQELGESRESLENSKDFRSSVTETGVEIRYIFLIINHNITGELPTNQGLGIKTRASSKGGGVIGFRSFSLWGGGRGQRESWAKWN